MCMMAEREQHKAERTWPGWRREKAPSGGQASASTTTTTTTTTKMTGSKGASQSHVGAAGGRKEGRVGGAFESVRRGPGRPRLSGAAKANKALGAGVGTFGAACGSVGGVSASTGLVMPSSSSPMAPPSPSSSSSPTSR
jgi:hypothetical protein